MATNGRGHLVDSYYLLAYFLSEDLEDGEAVRFAVSGGPAPTAWQQLADGEPVLTSTVSSGGARDPFLIRDAATHRFYVVATDLRVWPNHEWTLSTRRGSTGIVVWESPDLLAWSSSRLVVVAPAAAGNAWAPKAFWDTDAAAWRVFWASALYEDEDEDEREQGSYQRILVATTRDFREFSAPEVYLDLGHDVIDATFLEHAGAWYRFSANAQSRVPRADLGHHIFEEVGSGLMSPHYRPLAYDIGKGVMTHAEGPAVAADPSGQRWYLLADDYPSRGYQLFATDDLSTGSWQHVTAPGLPAGARHGSLLQISSAERGALLDAKWA